MPTTLKRRARKDDRTIAMAVRVTHYDIAVSGRHWRVLMVLYSSCFISCMGHHHIEQVAVRMGIGVWDGIRLMAYIPW